MTAPWIHDGTGPDVDPATGDEAETFQPPTGKAPPQMLYRLSKLVPVLMRSTYTADGHRQRSVWVQWRGRVFAHHVTPIEA